MVATGYTCNVLDQLISVSMPRSGATQTRTFTYNGLMLASETHPETGTTTYAYTGSANGAVNNSLLASKIDANGTKTAYTYDRYLRVTDMQIFPGYSANAGAPEDVCQHVHYTYDTNPYDSTFSTNAWGHMTSAQTGPIDASGNPITNNASCAILSTPPTNQNFIQMFGYSSGGLTTGKRTRMIRTAQSTQTMDWDTLYGFDGEGYLTSTKYPDGSYYNVVLDALRRPSQLYYNTSAAIPTNNLPIIDQVTYNASNQMTQMLWFGNPGGQRDPNAFSYNAAYQAWIYNTENQMVETYTFLAGSNTRSMDLTYQYGPGRNNGQIYGLFDPVNNQQTIYTYDSLKRLSTATATTGSTTNWGQSYSYDQFGNLNGKTITGGSGITFNASVDPQTNRLMGGSYCYDNNGNLLSDSGYACNGKNAYPPFTQYNYDGKNRLTEAQVSGGNERYYYTPDNKRVNIQKADGSQVVFVYGAQGEITALCSSSASYPNQLTCRQQYAHLMFGGRLVRQFGAPVALDRLGSVKSQPGGSLAAPGYFGYNGVVTYLPFGEDLNQVFQDETKFGTYWEDSSTGFSYADQRFYASRYGRFMSADPYKASAGPEDPGSWNRYSYVKNDPINLRDPHGLFACAECDDVEDDLDDGYSDFGGGGINYGGASGGISPPSDSGSVSGAFNQGNRTKITSQSQAAGVLANEINNLSANCQRLLSMEGLQQLAGSLSFWDSRVYGPVVVSTVIPGAYPGTFASLVGNSFAVTVTAGGNYTPNIDLGTSFFNSDPGRQGLTLLHELLHVGLAANDASIDSTFGIHGSYAGQDASSALSDWLSNDCKNH